MKKIAVNQHRPWSPGGWKMSLVQVDADFKLPRSAKDAMVVDARRPSVQALDLARQVSAKMRDGILN